MEGKALFRQYVATITCVMSVMITATAFVWLAPLMLWLVSKESEIPMTTDDSSWLVSSIEIGEVLTTVPAGLLADRYGRKTAILTVGPLCLASYILAIFTRSMVALYIVRMIQGAALGVAYTVGPIYLAEISDPRIRGQLSSIFMVLWYAGMLFNYAVGPYLSYTNYSIACGAVAIAQFLMFLKAPESPYYLLMKNKPDKALKSLVWLRASEDIDVEFKSIQKNVEHDMSQRGSWKDLVATKADRKSFLIVQLVCCIKYMNGMSPVCNYATQTLAQKEGSSVSENELSIIMFSILVVTTTVGSFGTDRCGRRAMIIASTVGCTILSLLAAGYFYYEPSLRLSLNGYYWIGLSLLTGFAVVANIGLGPLMQTIQAEYFPSHTRGIGGGVTEMVASVAAFISMKHYQPVSDYIGMYANYIIFALISGTGTIVLYFVLPETSGQSLGEIQANFKTNAASNKGDVTFDNEGFYISIENGIDIQKDVR